MEVSRCGARQGLRRGRRQGSSWVESEHILRAHMGSSVGERACAGAREKSAGQAQALALGPPPVWCPSRLHAVPRRAREAGPRRRSQERRADLRRPRRPHWRLPRCSGPLRAPPGGSARTPGEGRDRRGLKVSRGGEAARGFSVVHGRVRRGLEVSRCGARQGLRRGRRQGSSWVESEHIVRAHMGSSLGERACAGAREKSALPLL